MPELERTLMQLGRELDWPRTPDLAAAVGARLSEPRPERRPATEPQAERRPAPRPPERRLARQPLLRSLRRSLALALALVLLLVLAAAALAALPGVRDAVLDFFGLQGATVERRTTLPTPPPERPLDLGQRTTLDAAADRIAFEPLVPDALGEPDAVYLREGTPGGELSLAYRARPGLPRARTTRLGLLLSEFRGDLDPNYVGKIAGPDVTIEKLTVDGARAIWIEGVPHLFFYRGPGGAFVERELRLAQNVLLVERGPLLVRLEGAFNRERAIRLARSLR